MWPRVTVLHLLGALGVSLVLVGTSFGEYFVFRGLFLAT